jgi:hypothetical protein
MKKATIVAHRTYPGMYRVRWPDGQLSDMANLSRVNDASERFNESLERELRGRQTHSEAPSARSKNDRAA